MSGENTRRQNPRRFAAAATGILSALTLTAALGVSSTAGVITTLAGGPGTGRPLDLGQSPTAVAVGSSGQLYVADRGKSVIRRVAGNPPTESVVAGNGGFGFSGDGGAATASALAAPTGVARDAMGNLLIVDSGNQRVRVVAARTASFYGLAMTAGDIYTVAGNGTNGFSGDGGPATATALSDPYSVAGDANGNLVISDSNNERIRVVAARTGTLYGQAMTAGDIYTVAGSGPAGFSGDGGPGTAAKLALPYGVAVDTKGNVVIADYANSRIRVVAASSGKFYGQNMTVGYIYTVAGNGGVFFSGDGVPATAAALAWPYGVAVDSKGNLLIADTWNFRVRVVAAGTGSYYGQAMTAGDIYTAAGNGAGNFSGDGGPAVSASLSYPSSVVADAKGNLVIADEGNIRVRVVAGGTGTFYGVAMTAHDIYTVAGNGTYSYGGDGGSAAAAEVGHPSGVARDVKDNVIIADSNNNRVRVVATSTGSFYGVAMTAGHIYTVAGNGTGGFAGDGGPAAAAEVSNPSGVAVDTKGNLVIADTYNNRIRVVATSTGTFYRITMTAGDIYTVAGTGAFGFSGDGGPAVSAELRSPSGVAVDTNGNVLLADMNNFRVRVVAASTGSFYGTSMTVGDIYTVAGNGTRGFSGDGGPATTAALRLPLGVTVDAKDNLIIADTINNRVRVVASSTGSFYGVAMATGDIYTVAGRSSYGFSGDGARATSAKLYRPSGVAVDTKGNLVIADTVNNRIRVVAVSTGTFYGVAMKAGDIYTVAGDGIIGFTGDGGPAIAAGLNAPGGAAVLSTGNLLIADTGNDRIRRVTGP